MREIMAGMRDQPVTQEELDIARESVLNGFVSVLESPLALARQRAILEFREYPEGWLERFRDIVRSMTLEDVQAMAKKYLRPDRLRIVLVCNPADLDAAPADLPPAETIQVR